MKNVLITGGAGFIGSHLTDHLVDEGHSVTVIDCLESQVHHKPPTYLNPGATYHFDRTASPRVPYSAILPEIDTAYYFASKVGPNQSMTDIGDYIDSNINGLGCFLNEVQRHAPDLRRIVLSGSMGPYGEGTYRCTSCAHVFHPSAPRDSFEFSCPACESAAINLPLDEETPISNISFYGLSKNVQESMLRLYAGANDIEFVSLRYFSVYGPRQTLGNPYAGPIPIWLERALAGSDLVVYEDGLQTRDFIHVRDITRINSLAGTIDLPEPIQIVNCGTGVATKIIDVATLIKERTGAEGDVVIAKTIRPGDLRHSPADNSRLRELLGVDEFLDVRQGLAELIDAVVQDRTT